MKIEADNQQEYKTAYHKLGQDTVKAPVVRDYWKAYMVKNESLLSAEWYQQLNVIAEYSSGDQALKYSKKLDAAYAVLKKYPPHYWIEITYGGVCREYDRIEDAIAHFNRALQEIPNSGYAYYMLGALSATKGHFEEARNYSQKAMKYAKNSDDSNDVKARAMHNLGILEFKMNEDLEKAIGYLESALFVKPDYENAQVSLQKLREHQASIEMAEKMMKGSRNLLSQKKTRRKRPKVFHPMTSLNECLLQYTKDELLDICKVNGIRKISQLTKNQLVENMASQIPGLLREILYIMPINQLDCLYQIAEKGGHLSRKDAEELEILKLEYFMKRGMLNMNQTDTYFIHMPAEIIDVCLTHKGQQASKAQGLQVQQYVDFAIGMLVHYGYMSITDMIDKAQSYGLVSEDVDDWFEAILQYEKTGTDFVAYGSALIYWATEHLEEVLELRRKNGNFPYAKIGLDEIMSAGKTGHVSLTTDQKSIFDELLLHADITEAERREIQEELVLCIQNRNDPKALLLVLMHEFGIKQSDIPKHHGRLLERLKDCIGIFAYKGHARKLISYRNDGRLALAMPKVGRNDPCPCGSGKKFKKCCLK